MFAVTIITRVTVRVTAVVTLTVTVTAVATLTVEDLDFGLRLWSNLGLEAGVSLSNILYTVLFPPFICSFCTSLRLTSFDYETS